MIYGLNAWWTPDHLAAIRSKGFTMARISTRLIGLRASVRAVQDCQAVGLRPLLIVRDAPEIATLMLDLSEGIDIELANEPDYTTDDYWSPADYALETQVALDALEDYPQHRLWIGAVTNLNRSALGWLETMLSHLPADAPVGITAHLYEPPDWPRFLRIVRHRPWGISEFGYHTGKQPPRWRWLPKWWPGNCATYTDADVARLAKARFEDIAAHGAEFACYYQYADGPTTADMDRFGIRRCDPSTGELTTWKPVANIVP
jgi:hypothetical protein